MKNKRDIYCEYAFWEAFFAMEEKVLHNREKRKLWDSFYEFVSNNNLYFNIPNNGVNDETPGGKYLNELMHKKGGAGIQFLPDKFPTIEHFTDVDDNKLNSVFLTMNDSAVCKRLAERFGVMVFNLDMVFSANHVYFDNGIAFDKKNGENWKYLWKLKDKCPSICHCNSLVVVDRYLLYDNENKGDVFNANLKPIFEAFLPQALDNNIVFTICIIAENKSASIKQKLSEIKGLIKKLRPNLTFRLNLYESWILHDRSIITNNAILTSGVGFDVITSEEKARKFTTTSLWFPFFQAKDNANNPYLVWIRNVLNVKKICECRPQHYWGDHDTKHHLLDFYYERPARPQPRHRNFGNRKSDFMNCRDRLAKRN